MMKENKTIIEGIDKENISAILVVLDEINQNKRQLDDLEIELKILAKDWLKKRRFDKYQDKETGISVSVETKVIEDIDWVQVRYVCRPNQIKQFRKTKEVEVVQIIDSKMKEKLKKMVKR